MIVAVFSAKGGAAKTTTALNLGAALHHIGVPVALVDLDMSRTLLDYAPALPGVPFTSALPAAFDGLVLLDCPPATADVNSEAIMARANLVLIPTQPARVACNEAMDAARIALKVGKPARILMTKRVGQVDYSQEIQEELEREVRRLRSKRVALCRTVIPFSHDVVRAENAKQTVFSRAKGAERSSIARAHLRLAREVMTWQNQQL